MQDSWQTPRNARTLAAYMALKNREIGERIAALRKSRGNPPQEVVAQKLDVANRSYQAWEAGDTKPSWRNLSKVAKFYGVTEEFILIGDGPPKATPTTNGTVESELAAIRRELADIKVSQQNLLGDLQEIRKALRSLARARRSQAS